jgi:hypothetical protein
MKLLSKISPVISGIEMSLPVNLISEMAHVASQGEDVTNPAILINSLLAYNVYKFDRYLDAQTTQNSNKQDFYNSILENKKSIEFLLFSSSICILTLLIHYDMKSIIPLYLSTFMYKPIKKVSFPIKPFYVSSLWAISTCVIPDYPYYNLNEMLPVFLNIFALTNLADISDTEEDTKYNVSTLPTKYGKHNTFNICILCSFLSCYTYSQLQYFDFSSWNNIFLISNIIPYLNFTL